MQNIRIRFSDTGHHHSERSRCHRHPGAHRWYHRPLRLQSLNRGHVRRITSPKEDHHPISSVLPAVLRYKLLHLVSLLEPSSLSSFQKLFTFYFSCSSPSAVFEIYLPLFLCYNEICCTMYPELTF